MMDPQLVADDTGELEQRLGVSWRQRDRLLEALTHRSFINEHAGVGGHNERLEFLGDAVLDLVVSELLMARHPDAPEGDLTRMRAAVVREGALARVARELELGRFLRLGRGEVLSGGRAKPSLLSDAVEALLGAIYLSEGLPAVRQVVLRLLGDELAALDPDHPASDHKTRLQERVQRRHGAAPDYRLVGEQGPSHDRSFEVEVWLGGRPVGRGAGQTKKAAEQAAALRALASLPADD